MDSPSTDAAAFDSHLAAWRAWQGEPWGRLRYAVVWHVLQRHLASVTSSGKPLRILDVGGGDGTEAVRLASDGHAVTLVDYSAGMLGVARRIAAEQHVSARLTTVEGAVERLDGLHIGEFDVVLCHFVIQYLAEPAQALAAIERRLRAGGFLSLVAPNPAGEVLATAVRERDFDAAHALVSAERSHAATFDQDVALITAVRAEALLADAGLAPSHRYGGRIVMDLVADDAVKYDAESFAAMERLEIALCGLSPYRDIGRFWQIVSRR